MFPPNQPQGSRAESTPPGPAARAPETISLPGPGAATVSDRHAPGASHSHALSDPSQVGPYKILERLGEGGMGVVYLAEQTTPIHRRVALKLVLLGMDSRDVLARFQTERQALALMDHPHIAKVLDAGVTEQGRPYFVMEYVPGVALNQYCDTHRLGTRERLRLFMKVCEAVQHAHQKGIVHRDLKPSNILVMTQGNEAVPKIIDFGVAKATQQHSAAKSLFTNLGMIVGTPEYMSPEQADLTAEDVDTRTDIYSLGVILYESMSGTLPFDGKALRAAGYEGMRRIIREEEPPKPSTRIASLAGTGTEAARNRKTELSRLVRELRGDLDWITLKALDKSRARRYASATEFAADIRHYLENEPVTARPPSAIYRLRKLVRRNRALFGGGTAAVAALVIGVVATTLQYLEAERAREQEAGARALADASASEALAVNDFLLTMLESASPTRKGPEVTVLELLDDGARRIDRDFAARAGMRRALHQTYAGVYYRLNEYAKSEQHASAALALVGDDPTATGATTRRLHELRGVALKDLGRDLDALRSFLEAQRLALASDGARSASNAETLYSIGAIFANAGDSELAEYYLRRAVRLKRSLADADMVLAKYLDALGRLLVNCGATDEAGPVIDESLRLKESLGRGSAPAYAFGTMTKAYWHQARGESELAFAAYERARDLYEDLYGGADRPVVAMAKMDLAGLATDWKSAGQPHPEARALEARWSVEQLGGLKYVHAISLRNRAQLLHRQGRPVDGDARFAESIAADRAQGGADRHPSEAHTRTVWGTLLLESGRLDEAELELRQALQLQRNSLTDESRIALAPTLIALGALHIARERPADARPLLEEAHELRRAHFAEIDAAGWPVATSALALGGCLAALGEVEAARALVEPASRVMEKEFGAEHPRARAARAAFAALSAGPGAAPPLPGKR